MPRPGRAHAQGAPLPVALLPPSGINVAPGLLEAARDILKDHLQRSGRYTVITPAGFPTPDEPPAAMAAQQATAVGAAQALVLRITHLGSSTRVRLTVYAAGSGQVVYWDSMSVTGGPGELDVVLQRLVNALVQGKPVRDSAELESVTNDEMNTLNRRTANKSFGIHLFTLFPFNTPDGKFRPLPGAGIFWLYDARSWMADVALDFGGRAGSGLFDISLGAYYPFLRTDFTPYAGAVVRYAALTLGGTGSSGLILQPTAGILLGRLSSVQLRAELGYFVDTFAEAEKSDPVQSPGSPGSDHVSHGFVLTVGLGF
ncbi:MAG: hypothetical protein ABJA82_14930 [Myxococcales bacterium]